MGVLAYYVSMDVVNDSIRQAVRVELAKRDQKQVQLAGRVGVTRQYLNDVLRGKSGHVPAVWQRIFDELDLELVVRPKDPPPAR
jgi:transcriptional regulator with XRE-family HTH domain